MVLPSLRHPLAPEDDAWLTERVHLEHPGRSEGGRFVLCWLVAALRAEDNPIVEAACRYAARHALPLLVYQGLTARAWYATDRSHAFILEGARRLAEDFEAQGIRYVCHLDADGTSRGLAALAREAHAVFTDEFPVGPFPRWRQALARASGRPVWTVDAACVLPMRVVGRAWERAFAFREATHASRLARLRPVLSPRPRVSPWEAPLPFEPLDLRRCDLAVLLASMRIDHGIAPVPGLHGGAHVARARWNAWRDTHLATYATRRTDAADPDGVSVLSPWLHFGMSAPWVVAAEAQALGAEKYLDELLTWRELAWCFCAHRPDHASVSALPEWARATLEASRHRRRSRPFLGAIVRGETGDEVFDLAQRSLLRRGVLHNNARMTWGRTLAAWFEDPSEGLSVLIDLNHRLALDGRDPASYGGILWCYGQFDSPRSDRGPLGSVQVRSSSQHRRRLDIEKYHRWIEACPRPRVLVVGAGISGLAAATLLHMQGVKVTVLDKGRAPGGRVATRHTPLGTFDHGAQFVTLRDDRTCLLTMPCLDAGVLRPWFDEVFRGSPYFSALARHLAEGLDVRRESEVCAVHWDAPRWRVDTVGGASFVTDVVVLTAPVPQSLALVRAGGVALDPSLRAQLEAITYTRCLAGMFTGPWPSHLPAHGVAPSPAAPLVWLSSNHAKGVSASPCLTAHAEPSWSEAHWDDDDTTVLSTLARAVTATTGHPVTPVALKRWRYARPETTLPGPLVHRVGEATLVFTGDAFDATGGRVEGAMLAGLAAAGRVLTDPVCRESLGVSSLATP